MPDYKKMYAILCGAISDALDILPQTVENLTVKIKLEKALETTEEMYIEAGEETE